MNIRWSLFNQIALTDSWIVVTILYLVGFLIFNFEKWKYDEGNCMWESRKNIAMCLGNKRLWMSTADMKRSEIRKKEWKKRKNEWKERKLQRATRVYWTSTHRVLYAVCIKMKCRSMCGVRCCINTYTHCSCVSHRTMCCKVYMRVSVSVQCSIAYEITHWFMFGSFLHLFIFFSSTLLLGCEHFFRAYNSLARI